MASSPLDFEVSYSASVSDTSEHLFAAVPRSGAMPLSSTAMPAHSQVIITPGMRWWEAPEFEALEQAVEDVFADPSPATDTFWANDLSTDLSYVLDMPWAPQTPQHATGDPSGSAEGVRYLPHQYLTDPSTGQLYLADIAHAEIPASGPAQTGELIRPYIDELAGGAVWADAVAAPPPTPVDGVGSAGATGGTARSRRDALADDCRLPSRRELRQRERAGSARAVAARRLAKGGMLVVTAFGVVAIAAPQVVPGGDAVTGALTLGAMSQAQPAVADDDPTAPAVPADAPRKSEVNTTVASLLAARLVKESAQAQLVGQAGQGAGAAVIALADVQARAEQARKAEMARAVRDAQRDPKELARLMVAEQGWSSSQFTCLDKLYQRESGWRYNARNPSSGAYGLGQALPASKMSPFGDDYLTNPATQIKWGLAYIDERYGTPCAAWAHSENTNPHWY